MSCHKGKQAHPFSLIAYGHALCILVVKITDEQLGQDTNLMLAGKFFFQVLGVVKHFVFGPETE